MGGPGSGRKKGSGSKVPKRSFAKGLDKATLKVLKAPFDVKLSIYSKAQIKALRKAKKISKADVKSGTMHVPAYKK